MFKRNKNKSTDGNQTLFHDRLVSLYRRALVSGIDMSEVDRKIEEFSLRTHVTEQVEDLRDTLRIAAPIKKLSLFVRLGSFLLPMLFMSVGMYLLGSAVYPIVGSFFISASSMQSDQLLSPIPPEDVLDVTPLVITEPKDDAFKKSDEQVPEIINEELDYTNLNNWFSQTASLPELSVTQNVFGEEYSIDIPKLRIVNAKVKIGGSDLNESLIAYPGTALPGDAGSPVIFGHSVLRSYYNPSEKNPRRYTSIFSTIMTLQPGDEIFITHNGVRYKYLVQVKTEVKPEDVYILKQNFSVKQLKLVTCTPEGTYLRRGVVTATLVPFDE